MQLLLSTTQREFKEEKSKPTALAFHIHFFKQKSYLMVPLFQGKTSPEIQTMQNIESLKRDQPIMEPISGIKGVSYSIQLIRGWCPS